MSMKKIVYILIGGFLYVIYYYAGPEHFVETMIGISMYIGAAFLFSFIVMKIVDRLNFRQGMKNMEHFAKAKQKGKKQ